MRNKTTHRNKNNRYSNSKNEFQGGNKVRETLLKSNILIKIEQETTSIVVDLKLQLFIQSKALPVSSEWGSSSRILNSTNNLSLNELQSQENTINKKNLSLN